jgi:hypothetical protein
MRFLWSRGPDHGRAGAELADLVVPNGQVRPAGQGIATLAALSGYVLE